MKVEVNELGRHASVLDAKILLGVGIEVNEPVLRKSGMIKERDTIRLRS